MADSAKTKQELDTLTEELDDLIAAAEQKILNLGLGVVSEIPLKGKIKLSFRKHKSPVTKKSEWQFVLVRPDESAEPLLDSERKYKLLAVHKIEEFIAVLTKDAQKELVEIKEAIKAVQYVIGEFDKAGV